MSLHSLPIFVRLARQPVILVGVGEAAEAKRRLLERAGALVVGEAAEARLAIVVDDEAAVARLKARGVLVNAVDRPDLCDFTLPAIVDRDPVIVAIGTGGVSAGLAAALRQRLETLLSPKLGALALLLRDRRDDLRDAFPDASDRRRAIGAALSSGGVLDLSDPDLDDPFWIGDLKRGSDWTVHHVRLHSFDPDKMTVGDARVLAQADRVLHRAEVPAAILDRARADAPRIVWRGKAVEPLPGLTVTLEFA